MDVMKSKTVVFRSEKQPDGTVTIYAGPAGTLGESVVLSGLAPANTHRTVARLYREHHAAMFGATDLAAQVAKVRQDIMHRIHTLVLPHLRASATLADPILTGERAKVFVPKVGSWQAAYLDGWLMAATRDSRFGVSRDGFFLLSTFTCSTKAFSQLPVEDLLVFLVILENFNFIEGGVSDDAVSDAV